MEGIKIQSEVLEQLEVKPYELHPVPLFLGA
jgi:hypothetical protein